MAISTAIPIDFAHYFKHGAAIKSEKFEPVAEWQDGKNVGQQYDKTTNKPLWSVQVIDLDPEARKGQSEVTVKIASATEPPVPPTAGGLPFRPAIFEGMTITPYVNQNGGAPRVAYSLRATDVKPAQQKPRGE